MKRKVYISPSLLACKKGNEEEQISILTNLGVDYFHFDVMDGQFVANTSFSKEEFINIKKLSSLPMDVHLMVNDVVKYVNSYIALGADIITIHYEALNNDDERIDILKSIRFHNIKAGISIKPDTDYKVLLPLLEYVDLILVMSVEPGKGGQTFIENSIDKIRKIKEMINETKYSILIEVDGGINDVTGQKVIEAGADIIVAGSYLFHKDDVKERINSLKEIL